MGEPTIDEFVDSLASSRLLTDAQIALLKKQLVGNPLDAEGLAAVLTRQKHLTSWQARQLLKGQTGFVLEHYRLLNPVGRGGMGHVFQATDSRSGNIVAVKVMARKLAGNQTLVSRFRREIRASSLLDCPNIVRTLDAGRVGKTDFMVMEFVNGDQVDRISNRLGRIPVGLACEIIRQVADGLQHAHERQMVHRDIKPSNMIVHWDDSGHGTVKLMDMGLVRLMSDDADEHTMTRTGQVMGTPDYMSPEQGWDTTQVDIRSDIYSLGCTLFRLLTGQIPFRGSNPLQVLSQRMQRDAPSVTTVCDDLPEDVANVVSQMTMRDPDARFQTPADVSAALQPFCESLTKAALREAARRADVNLSVEIGDHPVDEIDETDGTYRQFLAEVQEGSSVNLMLAGLDGGSNPETIPALDITPTTPTATARRSHVRSRQSNSFLWFAIGTPVIMLLIFVLVAFNGNGHNDSSAEQQSGTGNLSHGVTAEPVVATGLNTDVRTLMATTLTFEPTVPATAVPGQVWKHRVRLSPEQPTDGVTFSAGPSAPSGLKVDSDTGKLQWSVPVDHATGLVSFPVLAMREIDGKQQAVGEQNLVLNVEPAFPPLTLPEYRTLTLEPSEPFQVSMAVDAATAKGRQLRYRLDGRTPPGMKIDARTGEVTWTPGTAAFGRLNVTVIVTDEKSPDSTASGTLTLAVIPSLVEHVLPTLPKQSAKAGTTLTVELPEVAQMKGAGMPMQRVIMLDASAPQGMKVSAAGGEIVWDIPSDAKGTFQIPLTARLEGGSGRRSRTLEGNVLLEIDVIAADTSPEPSMSDEKLTAAVATLKSVHEKTLAQARTTAQKAALALRLLEQCCLNSAGIDDAALLKLIETELAEKSRSTDIQLEVSRLRAQRYNGDELSEAVEILKNFRRTGLSTLQIDRVVEHLLRLSVQAVNVGQLETAHTLLTTLKPLVRVTGSQGVAVMLMNDVNLATGLSEDLARGDAGNPDRIQRTELLRLLNRWQFQTLFLQSDGGAFVQLAATGSTPLADSGRSRWTIRNGFVEMTSEQQQAAIAFLDRSRQPDRFVVRFELLPSTNSCQFIFGGGGTDTATFRAWNVVLDDSGLGRIHDFRSPGALNDGAVAAATLSPDHANSVEIVVDGVQVVLRIHGNVVTQTAITDLTAGWLGVASNLRRPDPVLRLRNARILLLPTDP